MHGSIINFVPLAFGLLIILLGCTNNGNNTNDNSSAGMPESTNSTHVNVAPVLTGENFTAYLGSSFTGKLLGTDSDGQLLVVSVVAAPKKGELRILNATTSSTTTTVSYLYKPSDGTDGEDNFTVKAFDGMSHSEELTVAVKIEGGPASLSLGDFHTCAISRGGNLKCWGRNNYHELGYSDIEARLTPTIFVHLGTDRTAKKVEGGYYYTCAILDDGSAKCWGRNLWGQLGYGNIQDRTMPPPTPLNLGSGHTAKQISAGRSHTCVLLENHTVKCFGLNSTSGVLGYGDTEDRLSPPPTPIDLGGNAKEIDVGKGHSCSILENGTVKCWGGNDAGQLGYDGILGYQRSPPTTSVALGVGRTAKKIALGAAHTCVLLDDGSIKCWGYNNKGQLGLGDTDNRSIAQPVGIVLGVGRSAKSIACGNYHTCAILDNGSVKCWGDNYRGQLGYGDNQNRLSPDAASVNLGNDRTAKQLGLGAHHTCALLDNDTIKCWGYNGSGMLGYGDINDRGIGPNQMGDLLPSVVLGEDF